MSYSYPFDSRINLHVENRVSRADAERQMATAREILRRLEAQPGVILADEVGMGKTFVALAVAASVALSDHQRRPIVVMVPPSLKEKWPQDFNTFRERCLPPDLRDSIQSGSASRAVAFLKLLDDPPDSPRRKSLIFLTHGAMNPKARLQDGWVKLALIQRAIHNRHEASRLRERAARWAGPLLRMGKVDWTCRHSRGNVWLDLLRAEPRRWLKILHRYGIDPEGDDDPDTDDDPVPRAILEALTDCRLDELHKVLLKLPRRESAYIDERLKDARRQINSNLTTLWEKLLSSLEMRLPLLILDEAHHLKNARTRLASLFQDAEAQDDAEQLKGPLGGVFERMMFLTATPFQLGHYELCSVLDRFKGVCWSGPASPTSGRDAFENQLEALREHLNEAQHAALRLEDSWAGLAADDLSVGGTPFLDVEEWWQAAQAGSGTTPPTDKVLRRFSQAQRRMRTAEDALKPWVIRHLRPRLLPEPFQGVPRRRRLAGNAILKPGERQTESGIQVCGQALLPFLLAARATACNPQARPVFAEGLASCFESFLHTRKLRSEKDRPDAEKQATDEDDETTKPVESDESGSWYLDRLTEHLPKDDPKAMASHPKLAATVKRVMGLWDQGHKVLVFCHYVVTGRVLRQRISEAIRNEIVRFGAAKLKCPPEEVHDRLERIGDRFDMDRSLGKACADQIGAVLKDYGELRSLHDALVLIVRRFLRTPSFLVRFFPLEEQDLSPQTMAKAFDYHAASSLSLRGLLDQFLKFLSEQCEDHKREAYVEALRRTQPGSHTSRDISQTFELDELQETPQEQLIPNVRLVNGQTKSETRQRLLLTFNTPFYPEVLIASAVMAEGVDLHQNCSHIIHHDLCWNPSTLEQRTGRVDRIGAKAERNGHPIEVYLPYISQTQDEKMYRVVLDRERWFQVIMGEKYKMDAASTDRLAERIPLPEGAARSLKFNLEVAPGSNRAQDLNNELVAVSPPSIDEGAAAVTSESLHVQSRECQDRSDANGATAVDSPSDSTT